MAASVNPLWILVPAVVVVNFPFGFWRAGVRKFSPAWFVAVHAPVPLVIVLRHVSGVGFQLASFPLVIAAYFLGQVAGARIRRRIRPPVSE